MSEGWLFVYLAFFAAVYFVMHLPRPWFQRVAPFSSPVLFTLVLPLVSPIKSVDYSTWLMLNCSCKMMCLFINTNAGLLLTVPMAAIVIKQILLCLRVWEAVYPARSVLKTTHTLKHTHTQAHTSTHKHKCSNFDKKGKRGTCPWNVVETDFRFAFLIFCLDEGAGEISKLFGFSKRFP